MLVHSPHYVNKLMEGSLTAREELEMEIPYSPQVVDTFMLHTGGSILAAERAIADGACVNIGGGFHHAFPDHGEGFCMMHDFAVAIRSLQKRKLIQRAMTVDCDVHQGNGTAYIFGHSGHQAATLPSWPAPELGVSHRGGNVRQAPSKSVFTISLHQENNYPFTKPPSSIDVNLPDGCGDADYLAWLDNALSSGLRQFEPDLICYVAGADPYREDQLGGLDLSIDGLKQRDELVFRAARARSIPVMVTLRRGLCDSSRGHGHDPHQHDPGGGRDISYGRDTYSGVVFGRRAGEGRTAEIPEPQPRRSAPPLARPSCFRAGISVFKELASAWQWVTPEFCCKTTTARSRGRANSGSVLTVAETPHRNTRPEAEMRTAKSIGCRQLLCFVA